MMELCDSPVAVNRHRSITFKKHVVTWTLKNVSHWRKPFGEFIESPEFNVGCGGKLSWNLVFYPGGCDFDNERYVGIFLKQLSRANAIVKYKMYILDSENMKSCSYVDSVLYTYSNNIFGNKQFASREHLFRDGSSLRPNDILTIFCELEVSDKPIELTNNFGHDISLSKLTEDFKNLFQP